MLQVSECLTPVKIHVLAAKKWETHYSLDNDFIYVFFKLQSIQLKLKYFNLDLTDIHRASLLALLW